MNNFELTKIQQEIEDDISKHFTYNCLDILIDCGFEKIEENKNSFKRNNDYVSINKNNKVYLSLFGLYNGKSLKNDIYSYFESYCYIKHNGNYINALKEFKYNSKEDSEFIYFCCQKEHAGDALLLSSFPELENYCFVPEHNSWFVYDNNYWQIDNEKKIDKLTTDLLNDSYSFLLTKARELKVDFKTFHSLIAKRLTAINRTNNIQSVLTALKSYLTIPIAKFDCNLNVINLSNGILEFANNDFIFTKHLGNNNKHYYCTKKANFNYSTQYFEDFKENYERSEENLIFLYDSFFFKTLYNFIPDVETREYIMKYFSLCMFGHIEKSLLFFYGYGNNGKSTLLNVFNKGFGTYAGTISSDLLIKSKMNNNENDRHLTEIEGKRLVIFTEIPESSVLKTETLKQLTGGEEIRARQLYAKGYNFKSQAKLILSGNHKPQVYDATLSVWNRLSLIPFEKTVEELIEENVIKKVLSFHEIENRMNEDNELILAMLCFCYKLYIKQELKKPHLISSITTEYKEEQDNLKEFLEIYFIEEKESKVRLSDIWNAYNDYTNFPNGETKFYKTKNHISKALVERNFKKINREQNSDGNIYFAKLKHNLSVWEKYDYNRYVLKGTLGLRKVSNN